VFNIGSPFAVEVNLICLVVAFLQRFFKVPLIGPIVHFILYTLPLDFLLVSGIGIGSLFKNSKRRFRVDALLGTGNTGKPQYYWQHERQ
jgi:hypothetical protein